MSDTIVYTQPRGGGAPVAEFPAEIIRYTYRQNRPGALQMSLALDHPKTVKTNVEEGVHEIVVRRNGANVWAGPVLTVDEDDTSRVVDVGCEGLMAHFRRAHVTSTLTYSDTVDDQTAIAWALITHHQNKAGGDYGITDGTTASGRKRTREYPVEEHKNVFEALIQLSEVDDGFDFEFKPDRSFVTYYPRQGTRRSDIVFDERNIRSFTRRKDATTQASSILAVGAGEGASMVRAATQSSTAVAKYGLTHMVVVDKDITVASTLNDKAQWALDEFADVPNLIALTVNVTDPQPFSYGLGDEVRVKWPSPYDPIDEFQRVIGYDIIWTSGEEQAVLFVEPI
jgi:hypothetical protein